MYECGIMLVPENSARVWNCGWWCGKILYVTNSIIITCMHTCTLLLYFVPKVTE